MVRRFFWLGMLLVAMAAACGCTKIEKTSLVKNGDFTVWNGSSSLPAEWRVEGKGVNIRKSDVVVDKTGASSIVASFLPEGVVVSSPFVFQQITDVESIRGKEITLGAWVKTSTPNAVAIEFSDRAGMDVKSSPHPGDGTWKYLAVTHRLPEDASTVEYRLRFYAPAEAYFADATLVESGWF